MIRLPLSLVLIKALRALVAALKVRITALISRNLGPRTENPLLLLLHAFNGDLPFQRLRRLAILNPLLQTLQSRDRNGAGPASAVKHTGHFKVPEEVRGLGVALQHALIVVQRAVGENQLVCEAVPQDNLAAVGLVVGEIWVVAAQDRRVLLAGQREQRPEIGFGDGVDVERWVLLQVQLDVLRRDGPVPGLAILAFVVAQLFRIVSFSFPPFPPRTS